MGQRDGKNMKEIKINIKTKSSRDMGIIDSDYKIEKNKYTLDLVNSWINNADTKISISCGLSSVVLAIITFIIETYISTADISNGFNVCILNIAKIVTAIGLALFLLALWFHFWALNPSLISIKSKKEEKNSLFFGSINSFENVDAYIKHANSITKERYNIELMEEIYINSSICTKKMKRFRTGMWFSIGSILFAVGAGVCYYLAIIPVE